MSSKSMGPILGSDCRLMVNGPTRTPASSAVAFMQCDEWSVVCRSGRVFETRHPAANRRVSQSLDPTYENRVSTEHHAG